MDTNVGRSSPFSLGCRSELNEVEAILWRGTGADEQLLAHAREGSLLGVARWLAAHTVAGL
jgi:hypothetical protein